jgi:hypothetical protein
MSTSKTELQIASSREQQNQELFAKRMFTAGTLGLLSLTTLELRRRGLTHDLPDADITKPILDSTAHPVLGYTGAWLAYKFSRLRGNSESSVALFTGSTFLNFSAEGVQSLVHSSPQTFNFLSERNLPETAKDYLFALTGLSLFLYQSRNEKD